LVGSGMLGGPRGYGASESGTKTRRKVINSANTPSFAGAVSREGRRDALGHYPGAFESAAAEPVLGSELNPSESACACASSA
jgi:hypothetical protein